MAAATVSMQVTFAKDAMAATASAEEVIKHGETLLKLAADLKGDVVANDHAALEARARARADRLRAHQAAVRRVLETVRDDAADLLLELETAYYAGLRR